MSLQSVPLALEASLLSNVSVFWVLCGGIVFLMYGMSLVSQALDKIMGPRISYLMQKLHNNHFMGISIGVLLTLALQSSSAVTSMLVSLGSAKVISLRPIMGVIIGTTIGSTLTVQVLSLPIKSFALPILFISFTVWFVAHRPEIKNLMQVGMGFGLLFFGLDLISSSALEISRVEWLQYTLNELRDHPFLSLFAAALFCAFVHSSAVTIGLTMGFLQAGLIDMNQALFWVYGANIGTTSTAILAAAGSNYIGRQVAWAHFFYKFIGVLVFLIPWVHQWFYQLMASFEMNSFRAVANAHLLFNLINAVLFFPFINKGALWIEKLFPKAAGEDFQAEFIKMDNYQNSAIAMSYAKREILRTTDIFIDMLKDVGSLLTGNPEPAALKIREKDKQIDYLYRELKVFLLEHSKNVIQAPAATGLLMFVTDLEHAADVIDHGLVTLSLKRAALKLELPPEDLKDLKIMLEETSKTVTLAIHSYEDRSMCGQAIEQKRKLSSLETEFRQKHIQRLHEGLEKTIHTSHIYLEYLSDLKRVGSLMCSHAYLSQK